MASGRATKSAGRQENRVTTKFVEVRRGEVVGRDGDPRNDATDGDGMLLNVIERLSSATSRVREFTARMDAFADRTIGVEPPRTSGTGQNETSDAPPAKAPRLQYEAYQLECALSALDEQLVRLNAL